jgi:hypothetical protein
MDVTINGLRETVTESPALSILMVACPAGFVTLMV